MTARNAVVSILRGHLEHAYDRAQARHDDYLRGQLTQRVACWLLVLELRRLLRAEYADALDGFPAYLLDGSPDWAAEIVRAVGAAP